eukprot:EG_transcript_4042
MPSLLTDAPAYHTVELHPADPLKPRFGHTHRAALFLLLGLCCTGVAASVWSRSALQLSSSSSTPQLSLTASQPQAALRSGAGGRRTVPAGLVVAALAAATLPGQPGLVGAAYAVPPPPQAQGARLQSEDLVGLTKFLPPELAADAPPLVAGENYDEIFDADYNSSDSFENILGAIVKLLVFAPVVAFLGFFLYGFLAGVEQEERQEATEADLLAPPAPTSRPAVPMVDDTLVPEPLAQPEPVLDRTIISLDNVAVADAAKEHVALYFRPIPEGVGFAEMRRLFRTFGEVECLALKEDHGFVWMNEKAAATAIAVLHGGEFRHTRMIVRLADTNKLPPAQRQVIFRQCQVQSQLMEKTENRSIHYFRCLASTAAKAAKNVGKEAAEGEEKSVSQKALENMAATLADIAAHHAVDTVDRSSTAQAGLDELVRLAAALRDAPGLPAQQQAAVRILDCITKYADMEVIPHHSNSKAKESNVALYFRPVPKGVEPAVYEELFNRYGDVEAIQLKDRYGFVWMEEAGAKAAMELLQGCRVPGGKLFLSVAKSSTLAKSDKAKATRFPKKVAAGKPAAAAPAAEA